MHLTNFLIEAQNIEGGYNAHPAIGVLRQEPPYCVYLVSSTRATQKSQKIAIIPPVPWVGGYSIDPVSCLWDFLL